MLLNRWSISHVAGHGVSAQAMPGSELKGGTWYIVQHKQPSEQQLLHPLHVQGMESGDCLDDLCRK